MEIPSQNSNPQRILVYGMFGSINVGDELAGLAVADGLRCYFPQAQINLASAHPDRTAAFLDDAELNCLPIRFFDHRFWLRLPAIVWSIKRMDAVVVGGGGLFQDQYMWRLPAGSALMGMLGVMLGKPTCAAGVGVGPVRRPWLVQRLGVALTLFDLVCVRDQASADTVGQLCGGQARLRLTADVVPSLTRFDALRDRYDTISKKISIVLRKWPGLEPSRVAALCQHLVLRGYEVQLQCYEWPDTALYAKIVAEIGTEARAQVRSISPTSARQAAEEIATSRCVLSMRLHGCVLSAMLGVPFVPVLYEPKLHGFAEQMNMLEALRTVQDLGPDLVPWLERKWNDQIERREQSLSHFEKLRERSHRTFSAICDAISQPPSADASVKSRAGRREALALLGYGALVEMQHLMSLSWIQRRLPRSANVWKATS